MRKIIFNLWENRRERFYKKKRWHLFLDLFLIALILVLAVIAVRLFLYNPSFINLITTPQIPITGEIVSEKKDIKFDFKAEALKSSVNLEEEIAWDIKYVNTGELEIDQAEFSFDLESSNFELLSFKAEGNLEIKEDSFIFKNIAPGETREARLSIAWRHPSFSQARLIEAALKTKSTVAKASLERIVNLPTIKINSQLNLEANLYYHSPQGDQLGIGPIPPVVGVPTKYWLILKASNRGNSLSNFVFNAQLAPGVEFMGEYSLLAGKFSYDNSKRRLIWQVDALDANGGDYIANFAVNFTPTLDQIGADALIFKNLEYYTTDDWTGVEISKKLYNLDTSLPADRLNKGEGKVLSE
jgi:hypothetical protein